MYMQVDECTTRVCGECPDGCRTAAPLAQYHPRVWGVPPTPQPVQQPAQVPPACVGSAPNDHGGRL